MRHRIGSASSTGLGNPSEELLKNDDGTSNEKIPIHKIPSPPKKDEESVKDESEDEFY